MGYIQLTNGLEDFSRIVISFWFRVPQASLDKANEADTGEDESAPFQGIIPLLVIGERGTGDIPYSVETIATKFYDHTAYNVVGGGSSSEQGPSPVGGGIVRRTTYYNPGASVVEQKSTSNGFISLLSIDGEAPPTDPTFIGVDSGGTLIVNVETNQKPDVTGGNFLRTGVTPGTSIGHGPPITFGGPEHSAFLAGTLVEDFRIFPQYYEVISDDTHWVMYPVQETTVVAYKTSFTDTSDTTYAATGNIVSDQIEVTPDVWHHVLVSMELKTIQSHGQSSTAESYSSPLSQYVDGASNLYVALDDKNYTEWELSSYWNEDGGANEVIADGAWKLAGQYLATDDEHVPFPQAIYDLSDPIVPASTKPLGVPATAEFVENIFRVEIAELQIFTDVVLDPAEVKNRRAFVDRDGKPVPPLPRIDPANEENILPPPAVELLGKKPEILLHGSANWSRGYNTGTLGVRVNEAGETVTIPSGQFRPTGQILSWRPDPTLHGPQKPSAPPPEVRLTRKPVAAE